MLSLALQVLEMQHKSEVVAGNVATSGTYTVGRFVSTKDEDGYAKVEVNLP